MQCCIIRVCICYNIMLVTFRSAMAARRNQKTSHTRAINNRRRRSVCTARDGHVFVELHIYYTEAHNNGCQHLSPSADAAADVRREKISNKTCMCAYLYNNNKKNIICIII